ncbi:chromatin regulatory protein Sir2 [Phyllosticta citribraziliensis]|uniref:Chromatin regulatory protein Sir2 n=1 Tax=Phyllosticta citribraziliensis TaxID=989973 RepID=A0ABR1LLW7_9PEZI
MATGEVLSQPTQPPAIDRSAPDNALSSEVHATDASDDQSAGMPADSDESDDELFEVDRSLVDEALMDEVDPEDLVPGPDTCSPQEARAYRARLNEVGGSVFVYETITTCTITAKKLCTAFGVKPPFWLEDQPDKAYYQVLGLAIGRALARRSRLPAYRTIEDAARLIKNSKNIMVITGAGISTSLGIPDFRSKNTGFYSRLREMGYDDPEQVFDIANFDEDPTIFYSLAGDIIPDLHNWTPTHQFIRLLQDKGKLLTNYTQNIDNLESHAGISRAKLVQCHGSWATATCRKCGYKIPGEDIFDKIKQQQVAECPECVRQLAVPRPGMKRKRSSNETAGAKGKKRRQSDSDDDDDDGQYDIPQPGVMKPDITFFGEPLPNIFFDRLRDHDKHRVDLVIIIGTSMKVAPVSEIPHIIKRRVPQIYISRDPIGHIEFDINLLGDCDVVVAELCRLAGWDLKHKMLPEGQKINVEAVYPEEAAQHTWRVSCAPTTGNSSAPGGTAVVDFA